ncbi:ATP-binding protein [Caproiciproducens galactitolivorans]|uniref:histidine kinase n=1 Tax=Caproiciproducens galactitolivorans TaxID=642589 RepID=A0ABT4BPY8_9FIRM|nr:ATP-binding protein [Caproiciproducens galactitolivorans]MCY1712967.1 ATP-binding protein [Caproiciproducens galactitolivorans]
MSIRKKMMIFVLIIEIVPMLFILLLSDHVLNDQVQKASQGYLQNALKIGYNQMVNRLDEMEKASVKMTDAEEFQQALQKRKIASVNEMLNDVNKVYDYIDFYLVFGADKGFITDKPPIKNTKIPQLDKLLEAVKKKHSAVTSTELIDLKDLFYSDSKEYDQYKVLISNDRDKNEYLTKCLVFLSVSPVYDKQDGRLLGYLVFGDIVNNDAYFPKTYSQSVENSYLAISVNDIRITSNIRSPKKQNFIGSSTPLAISTLKGTTNVFYGKVVYDGEVHIFLDKPIINYNGEDIGMLGVGIPEDKFSIIMDTQRNIIVFVTCLCLIIMIFITKYVSGRITAPILKATELANQISRGDSEIVIDSQYLEDSNSETAVLLNAFHKMVCDLKKSEEERNNYLEKLQSEHSELLKLSEQLAELNQNLEGKVRLRTQNLREAVNDLKKTGKIKSLFIANMSHELRTPLCAIINSAEVMQEEMTGPLNDKQHKYINNIITSGKHLLQLINSVLDLSKIEAGKMTLVMGDYSMSDIVTESFNMVKSLAYRKNQNVTIQMNPSDFIVRVDANKIKQILCNILSNAIKFTPQGGDVLVDVQKKEDSVQLRVKDNGIGIKEEDQKRIFNEFEQVDNSYEKQYEGTGLGLPLTKKLAELHNGKILLLSKYGEGTEVIVTIPIT